MIKLRKDSYLTVFSLRIALFIVPGGALTAMMIIALTYLPSAGNLWLALMIALTVLFFGIGLLAYCLWHDFRGDRHDGSIGII